jgi:glyoxylase-like metal-dependent hydrolase (beta-lactamase superfamily II)
MSQPSTGPAAIDSVRRDPVHASSEEALMAITNSQSGTNVHEIADGIYRINTPVALPGDNADFSFNQYLVVDDEPLLFHAGLRGLFPVVREAVAHVMPVDRLRHVAFSHVEADECGALNEWLAAAPQAAPLCGTIAAMVSIGDHADRPPPALACLLYTKPSPPDNRQSRMASSA